MIFGSSSDPVLVKKIYLKIWSLRSEIESVIKLKALNGNPPSSEEIKEINQEYQKSEKPHLSIVPDAPEGGEAEGGEASGEGDLEAEMAEAMEGGEEESGEAQAADGEEADLEAEMAAAMGGAEGEASGPTEVAAPSGPVEVIQRGSHNIQEDQLVKGMTILTEIGIDKIHFFSQVPFMEGQSIVLEFQIPQKFVVNCDVVYCRPFNIRSRIISANRLPYRIVANFTHLKTGERTLLRNFIESIEPEIPVQPEVKPKQAEDDGGDDFDDLDGLDF